MAALGRKLSKNVLLQPSYLVEGSGVLGFRGGSGVLGFRGYSDVLGFRCEICVSRTTFRGVERATDLPVLFQPPHLADACLLMIDG